MLVCLLHWDKMDSTCLVHFDACLVACLGDSRFLVLLYSCLLACHAFPMTKNIYVVTQLGHVSNPLSCVVFVVLDGNQ